MIIEFFCNAFFALAEFIIGIFPRFPSFDGLNTSFGPLFYIIDFVNIFVSVPLIGKCCTIILIVYNLKFVWSIVMWLVRKIPGVS